MKPLIRIFALVVRYFYLIKTSVPRILELMYWPTFQMILWGLISKHLAGSNDTVVQIGGALISGVLLWDILFRSQLGFSLSFLEEIWSRNLGQLFVSPLRPLEMVLSLMTISFIRTFIAIIPAALLAIPLYSFSIFQMGLSLMFFFVSLLITGWILGIFIIAAIIRFGVSAESLAWGAIFTLAPLSAVYYPVQTLPEWIRWLSLSFPQTYVFEGMREVLFHDIFRYDYFLKSIMLNIIYALIAVIVFLVSFEGARKRGGLINTGE
ncbi:MAG: ABC transporter permease [Pseudomonadota bacterium]|jgi:ABC-2 type transport system permease protein